MFWKLCLQRFFYDFETRLFVCVLKRATYKNVFKDSKRVETWSFGCLVLFTLAQELQKTFIPLSEACRQNSIFRVGTSNKKRNIRKLRFFVSKSCSKKGTIIRSHINLFAESYSAKRALKSNSINVLTALWLLTSRLTINKYERIYIAAKDLVDGDYRKTWKPWKSFKNDLVQVIR